MLFLLAAGGSAVGGLRAADAWLPDQRVRTLDAPQQQAQVVTFAAAGDHGADSSTAASLAALDQSGAEFYLALGDMDYDQINPDAAWCDYVKAGLPTLGAEFPFEVVAGNHEDDNGEDGHIMNHAACLPDRLSSAGTYGVEYYFDYPANGPLVRVIMISPDLAVGGEPYNYTAGSSHYNWLAAAIDGARGAEIPWVVVGMHKNCITAGVKDCSIGTDIVNLLVDKRVDVVLQGHDHNYQRSKQLAHGAACAAISAGSYDSDCVVDDGSDAIYSGGAGMLLVITGAFGRCCAAVNPSDAEAGYFATMSDTTDGFLKVRLSPSQLLGQFVASTGTFTDSFVIGTDPGDSDGDGFSNTAEAYLGTDPADPCGEPDVQGASQSWAADLSSGGVPDGTNRISISDLTSFLAPVRRMNTSPGDPDYSVRWDLSPGASVFPSVINIQDLVQLLLLAPPMFGGQIAFDGPVCAS